MNTNKLRQIINETSILLEKACTLAGIEYSALPRALNASMQVEKNHRRAGEGFSASYNVGIDLASRFMVTKRVVQSLKLPPARPISWVHVDGIRPDVITCNGIAEQLTAFQQKGGKRPETKFRHADLAIVLEKLLASGIDEVDYAEDIAC